MTLSKQLWLLISILLVSAFLGSFVFSSLSIRTYVEEQLVLKNTDTANALALTISQTEKDEALIETFMATQFDLGHFKHISLQPLTGEPIIFESGRPAESKTVPSWFTTLLPLSSPEATARVMDGWGEYGLLRVASDTDSAYTLLWSNIIRTMLWLMALLILVAIAARYLVRTITRPLEDVVRQAESIGRQQFIEAKEPNTEELKRVVQSMNLLSRNVKKLLVTERQHVEALRKSLHYDALTGLANRAVFMQLLQTLLDEGLAEQEHKLLIFRVMDLIELNQRLGRKQTDQILCGIADSLGQLQDSLGVAQTFVAARLNGSDFALLLSGKTDLKTLVTDLNEALRTLWEQFLPSEGQRVPIIIAATSVKGDDQREAVMTHVDGLLAQAEMEWPEQNSVISKSRDSGYGFSADQWRAVLTGALNSGNPGLAVDQVKTSSGDIALEELTLTIATSNWNIPAQHFRPWARRFGIEEAFDQKLFSEALALLATNQDRQLSVRLSQDTVSSVSFLSNMTEQLKRYPDQSHRLTLAIRESTAITSPTQFAAFAKMVGELGAKVGLVDASADFLSSDLLPSLGLSFIHLDPNLTTDIMNNGKEELFIQRICSVAHSVGMKVFIDEPAIDQKKQALQCGVDGFRHKG
ncbi:LapD/MoxY N-terminal periplasmic domain-containing protein [Marinobacter vinifirmus]|uniref:EAL domain-containing protein n=1 Tax=Marinobacter vinifirmus TaxID=355591 RepID=A0A558B733_9GAMM|nr:LapD/MoxY N-terminal periplasmic domain-containing protein [Marinobacter vinifirmus]TVT32321.1 MAG: EAL domain-containing protein [Marinobacter vinifirmus]